jgi:hypothetical protein
MDREERFAEWLDAGTESGVFAAPSAEEAVRSALGLEAVWGDPPGSVFEGIMAEIRAAGPQPVVATRRGGRRAGAMVRVVSLAAAVVVVVMVGVAIVPRSATFELAGTELAPGAIAEVQVADTPSGFEIRLDISGLDPAPEGSYYQAWVRTADDGVTIGTFHMRGGADEVVLWSGVDIADYPVITVTIQEEGAGAESSGVVVLKGEIPPS